MKKRTEETGAEGKPLEEEGKLLLKPRKHERLSEALAREIKRRLLLEGVLAGSEGSEGSESALFERVSRLRVLNDGDAPHKKTSEKLSDVSG